MEDIVFTEQGLATLLEHLDVDNASQAESLAIIKQWRMNGSPKGELMAWFMAELHKKRGHRS